MPDIDDIQKTWTMPDGWTINMKHKSMEVFDSTNELVATAITQISVIKTLQQHIEAQGSAVAHHLLMATLKKPVDG